MRKISLNILNLVILDLPPHKRQDNRIAMLQGLLQAFADCEADFYAWRDAMYLRATITGETAAVQWYLNELFDPTQRRILIVESTPVGTTLSTETEASAYMTLSTEAEATHYQIMKLQTESTGGSLGVDFRVLCPVAVNTVQLAATVKLYNIAHKFFDVVTF